MATKKVEFKLTFGTTQLERLRAYLSVQRLVWNRGLAILEWREWYDKWLQVVESPEHPDYTPEPVPLKWGYNEVKVGKKTTKVYGLCCDCVRYEKTSREPQAGEWRDKDWLVKLAKPEPIREHWPQEPVLTKHGKDPYFSLVSAFAKKHFDDEHYVQECEVAWTKGTCKVLADAWKSYKSGVRDRPRYKKQDPKTLMHPNSESIKIKSGRLTIPGFGKLRVKGLEDRWGDRPTCPLTLTLIGNTVYLQLTGKFEDVKPPKLTGRIVGIDPGSVRFYTDDEGHHVEPPKFLKQSANKLIKLQRKLARQMATNSTQVFDESGRCTRTEFKEGWERKNFKKTKLKIAKLHNKIARQRRAFAHYHSTKLVRFADEIALEDFKVANVTRAVKKGESGVQNGRKRKSGLNKSLLDNAIGQFYQMVEAKGKEAGRIVKRVPAHHTSQECNKCHHVSPDNRRSQAVFKCVKCGHTDNADRNAARNIKGKLREA
jgi:transposase